MFLSEHKILLQLINDSTASSMDAEMIKSKLEIRNVGFDLHIEELASNQVGKEEDLF